jgi:hypothetical protein
MIDDNIMYINELEAVHPNRPAGSENSVLREAAGRLDEGMITGWSKMKLLITYVSDIEI